ncbi:MAG: hypothetical protein KGL75_08295 [Acidobacteriota bacterium]|nr:hypothetical protein [Acidobacteriota bacterium]
MKTKGAVTLFCAVALASAAAFAQGARKFGWIPVNAEAARLDPANYYGGRTYHPSAGGGNMHVQIKAQQPVTIFMTAAGEWSYALQHPEAMATIHQDCARTHVTDTTYTCFITEPMTLVIEDERASTGKAVFASVGAALDETNNPASRVASVGLAAMLSGGSRAKRHFTAPNDVNVQYFRWDCVENCVQPEFQWVRVTEEQYKLTPYMKIYSGYAPDLDGEQISVSIKSPVPMVVALVPSSVASQLHENRQALESALDKVTCQQRAVQKLQFQCTFNIADGPQSLIVAPENDSRVPHKKADVEWFADKCVANCQPPPQATQPQGTEPQNPQN